METKVLKLPKTGDYYAYQVSVWHEGKLQFTLVKKLSGTEFAIALNRNCVTSLDDALKKLKDFSISEAKNIYTTGQYKEGGEYMGDFSPCW